MLRRGSHLWSRPHTELAHALLATCIDLSPIPRRAQERAAWTLAILAYVRRVRMMPRL